MSRIPQRLSRSSQRRSYALLRADVRLHEAPVSDANANTARWRINGHGATIIVWTADEWERLKEHPPDAQFIPCGIWCALRVD
jgi:hypothetical protein